MTDTLSLPSSVASGHSEEDAPASPYAASSPAERLDAVTELSGAIAALQAELGRVVVAVEDAEDHVADGAVDVASWLVMVTGLNRRHARETARVARALESLPALRAVFAAGAVSFDQVRPITRFATAETDAELARQLPGWSAAQAENLARRLTPKPDDEATTARARRELHWRPDHEAGGFRYRGFLPTDQAAAVNAALTELAERAGPEAETGQWDPFAARCADALHQLAVGDRHPGQASLAVLHVDAATVAQAAAEDAARAERAEAARTGRSGGCDAGGDAGAPAGHADGEAGAEVAPHGILDGVAVGRDTVLRYLCDCDIEFSVEGPHGTTVGIGRRSRAFPDWMRRHIEARDGTCRFPGCERAIRHIHHNRHWTRDRGPTDSHNCEGFCWAHHHLVHEGRWEVTGDADGEISLTSPYGRRLTSRRQPVRPTTRAAAARIAGTTLTVVPPSRRPGGGDGPQPP